MCISNIGNRRPFRTNGFQSRGTVDSSKCSSIVVSPSLKEALKNTDPQKSASHISKNHHIVVQHCYHDHAHDSRMIYQEDHPVRGGVTVPFPLKLHDMLNVVVENGHDHIVSWQPHGRCFVVHKPKEFVELLPYYFKLSKLASFQRQLNLYGFQRLTRGRDRGGYYHELFLKDRIFLAHSIQRIKVKGTGVRARSNPDQEPDFWTMPWVQPQQDDDLYHQTVTDNCNKSSFLSTLPPSSPLSPQQFESSLVNGTSSELPSTFFSQTNFLQMDQTVIPTADIMEHEMAAPEDEVLFGKHFYDVEQNCLSSTTVAIPPTSLEPPVPIESTDNQLNVLEKEMDNFFNDFDFPDDIGDEIEDDQVFGALLEQMIS